MAELQAGDEAPDFTAIVTDGTEIKLSEILSSGELLQAVENVIGQLD